MFQVSSNINDTQKKLEKLVASISYHTGVALRECERVSVRYILDNTYWSSEAVYKTGGLVGEPYDLKDSGRLLSTIENKEFNTLVYHNPTSMTIGIGNVGELDSLTTQRKNVSDPSFKYWRLAVYGRAAIKGWRFVQTGSSWNLKPRGHSVSDPFGEIAPSEPTNMFENGFFAAKMEFRDIINKNLKKAVGGKL